MPSPPLRAGPGKGEFGWQQGNSGRCSRSGIAATASKVGLPLKVVELDEAKVRETYERDLVLVRPDGHVAWRGNELPKHATDLTNTIRGAK